MVDLKNSNGDGEWKASLAGIAEDAKSRYLASSERLTEIAKSVDAARLFVAMLANTGFGPAEKMTEFNYGDFSQKTELLAYLLYPLFGASQETQIKPWHTNECMGALDELYVAHIQYRTFSRIENGRSDPASYLRRA